MPLQFEWDEGNVDHIAAHGVSTAEAEEALHSDSSLFLYRTQRNGEERIVNIGRTAAGRILFMVSTLRAGKIRVITAYESRAHRALYFRMKGPSDADERA